MTNFVSVSLSDEWEVGYISSEDSQCYVKCPCGEEFSIYSTPTACTKCGRIYWTKFMAYRLETKEHIEEVRKIKQGWNDKQASD